MSSAATRLGNKLLVRSVLSQVAEARPETVEDVLARAYHPDAQWRGSHPMNEMQGVAAIAAKVWQPLLTSFPDLERRDLILIGGDYEGHDLVGAMGHYCGVFRRDWLGIPATGRPVTLRYGEVHRVVEGRIAQSTVLIDVLDVIRQTGFWPLAPSMGVEMAWPAPFTADGVVLGETDPAVEAANFAQMRAMQNALGLHGDVARDGRAALLIPSQREGWHPKMMWYGPCGIGSTRRVEGFVDDHRLPFRLAFHKARGGQHYVRIADGAYTLTGGWPSVTAEHLGDGFLGLGATGRTVGMRVMDFYLHHEGLIRENWVPIDMIDLLRQMGCDVFGRMAQVLGPRLR
jgi:predicted ester cyclase